MIAETLRDSSCNKSAMESSSDSKLSSSDNKENDASSKVAKGGGSPSPANGEIDIKEEETEVEAKTADVKEEGDGLSLKEEDEGHVSSEDEDKLVINEGCDKKEPTKVEAGERESVLPVAPTEASESSPKSPMKRTIDPDPSSEKPLKKTRLPDDLHEYSSSMASLDDSLAMVKNDLQGIEILLAQKEEEWNSLLRLLKKKEELYIRLLRRRQVMKMGGHLSSKKEEEYETEEENILYPQGIFSSVVATKSSSHKDPGHEGGGSQSNISVIDIHTNNSRPSSVAEPPQISISPETQTKLGKQLNSIMSMKPILPKPLNCGGGIISTSGTLPPLTYPTTGYGPQGPTVSVQHIIAAHRKENPNIPPIRGAKRGAWRQRYESDKRSTSREPDRPSSVSSSNSESESRISASSYSSKAASTAAAVANNNTNNNNNNNNNLLTMNDPNASYIDVLRQFAQLTQSEKQPSSPQISIIPVSSGDTSCRKVEPTPDSTSVSRELPVSSQPSVQSHSLEGSSALAKLLLESGAGNHTNVPKASSAVDLSSYNASPHCLTLSALLSGGTTTTVKEKSSSPSHVDHRSKKSADEGNSNPKCQGCHKHRAQFVCAGCGNQWYCSRNCQVTAWEKHSEHCSS